MDEAVKITGQEYERRFFPFGGFLLVAKDLPPTQYGGSIIAPSSVRKAHAKFTSTGVIIRKSLFREFEDDHERYLYNVLKRGDRIGFLSTTPFYSPSPPSYQFEGDDEERYITIHVKDVCGVVLETEEARVEYATRFGRI